MKPRIGINGNWMPDGTSPALIAVRSNYVNAVAGAGGIPIVLPLVSDLELAEMQAELCDGFVFVGGPDINPAKYGEEPHPTWGPLAECREAYDFALIEAAMRQRKPFLAICLGCQEVNVVCGGSLIQDIACEIPTEVRHSLKQAPYLLRHDVQVEPGTQLHQLWEGVATASTNSAHHQSVKRVGQGLRVSARSIDGVVEALELEEYPYGLCIQWHPEYLQDEELHSRLFTGLIEAGRQAASVGGAQLSGRA